VSYPGTEVNILEEIWAGTKGNATGGKTIENIVERKNE
jgi:hypothetical protein